jgi:hypothetical protein
MRAAVGWIASLIVAHGALISARRRSRSAI